MSSLNWDFYPEHFIQLPGEAQAACGTVLFAKGLREGGVAGGRGHP